MAGLSRGEPFSLFLELNVLLYAGVLAFVAGLGWTVSTWSSNSVTSLSSPSSPPSSPPVFGTAFPAPPPGPLRKRLHRTRSSTTCFISAALFGAWNSLTWRTGFHVLSGQWDLYLLATAGLFFFLAYRFDNRFVLSLALSSLAGWFGLTHLALASRIRTRRIANMPFSIVCWSASAGHFSNAVGLKSHFFGTYLNIVANVLFWALLSGVFDRQGYGIWFLALLIACGASLAWGLRAGSLPSSLMPPSTDTWASVRCSSARHAHDLRCPELFRRYRRRHAGGAGPDRAPLREAGVRLYSAS